MATIENFLSTAEAKLSQKPRSENDPPRPKFVELLQSREAKSTDLQDRIYSSLCLCDCSVRDAIKRDYTVSLVDLPLLVARYLLSTHGPQALCLVEMPADDAALSTWAPSWAQAPGKKRHDWVHIWSNQGTQDAASGLIWKDDRTLQLQGTFVGVSTDVRKAPRMMGYRFQNHFGDDIPAGNFSSITKILFGSDPAEETNEEFIDALMLRGNGNTRERGVAAFSLTHLMEQLPATRHSHVASIAWQLALSRTETLFTCSEIVVPLSFYAEEKEFSRSLVHTTCMAYLTMSLADTPGVKTMFKAFPRFGLGEAGRNCTRTESNCGLVPDRDFGRDIA